MRENTMQTMTLEEEIDAVKTDAQLESEALEAAESKEEPKEEPVKEEPKAETEEPSKEPEGDKAAEPAVDEGDEKEAGEQEVPSGNDFGKPGHTPPGVQKRINELTSKTRSLESALSDKDKEIAELKRKMEGMRDVTRDDFIKDGKTEADWIQHVVAQRSHEEAVKLAERMREEEELKADLPGFQESEELARKLFSDYDLVVGSGDLPGSPRLSKFIRKEKVFGGQILYTLMKFPQERSLYVNAATEDDKLQVLKNIKEKLEGIAKKFSADAGKGQAQNPSVIKEPGSKESTEQPSQLREPTERKPSTTVKKKLNPSECSMEEWMTDGY